jgi:SnoaL-like domain
MSTGNVARRLIELCRAGKFDRAVDELYAKDARSIEMDEMSAGPFGNVEGLDAIKQKGKRFENGLAEVHGITVSDPLIAGPFFTIALGFDATYKEGGRRAMKEVCVYEVRDDKIVREQFFYSLN